MKNLILLAVLSSALAYQTYRLNELQTFTDKHFEYLQATARVEEKYNMSCFEAIRLSEGLDKNGNSRRDDCEYEVLSPEHERACDMLEDDSEPMLREDGVCA